MPPNHNPFSNAAKNLSVLDSDTIHQLRKGTKLLRARLQLLRLLGISTQQHDKLRNALRKLAHLLGGQRDSHVMYGLLKELKSASQDASLETLITDLQKSLEQNHLSSIEIQRIKDLLKSIEEVANPILEKPLPVTEMQEVLSKRLVSLCLNGDRQISGNDWEALHAWRKQVKKLMYQYGMKSAMTNRDQKIFATLDALGNSLGRINDLCILERHIREREKNWTRAKTLSLFSQIYQMIDIQRKQALEQSKALNKAILCER